MRKINFFERNLSMSEKNIIRWFDELSSKDSNQVGGKNASLGEMVRELKTKGINVPNGFATTSEAYWDFIKKNKLKDKIKNELKKYEKKRQSLERTGNKIRKIINTARFPDNTAQAISDAYQKLSRIYEKSKIDVAIRSSATAEDLPEASFAGQLESFLNISGSEDVLKACRKCYASLFTDRAIAYRERKGFDHLKIALSVGIQKMVRSDHAGAGVMFTIDTDSGFPNVIVINAAWGLGENVVQGTINPDEYLIFKPLLDKKKYNPILEKKLGDKNKKMCYAKSSRKTTKNIATTKKERQSFVLKDNEIKLLAKWGMLIEKHYQKPMDIEWAKDGNSGKIFIVQARPETVHSSQKGKTFKSFKLKEKGKKIVTGQAIGEAIASGKAQIIKTIKEINKFKKGQILVTTKTDPDWVPIMKKSAGIITDHGGRTSHAAIVSRELGVPAIVGTRTATSKLKDKQEITLSCAEGSVGNVYQGILDYQENEVKLAKLPKVRTQIMINIATPAAAFRWWRLPAEGIGLARMEFIINNIIKIHPMALVNFKKVTLKKDREMIKKLTKNYKNKEQYFIEHLSNGIAKIAASQYPKPVIVRMSDFKADEYANLIGGKDFEIEENNPMIGFRGAVRYYSDHYRAGFNLECRAIKRAREKNGLNNIIIMIPFCRTITEADNVLKSLEKNGLKRGKNDLKVYMMSEIPANVILAEDFSNKFDGFSIGTNDLTQLVLGVARDSEDLSELFAEDDAAVKAMIQEMIKKAHRKNKEVGLCGQAPSDNPKFAEFLVKAGIDSISVNPDSIVNVIEHVSKVEKKLDRQ